MYFFSILFLASKPAGPSPHPRISENRVSTPESPPQGPPGEKLIYVALQGYLKDSNAVAHSVDSDIFYTLIHLPAHSKTYINLYFLK